ncbi:MAG: alkaline phosphatase family protein [Coriobacteriia bacterium]|nr:alkaline phosphatase family protein [Coriobacteriia bacterium]
MKVRSWIALVVGTAVALACSYAAYTLANVSWNEVVEYRGPYAGVALPSTPAPDHPPLKTTRVVYVVIDGLRDDVSRSMPSLQRLRDGGYDAVVRTGEPSLSFPNWTTLLSGASQRISGVTTNWFEGRVPVETLVDVAVRSGRQVVVAAPKDFEQLYGVERAGSVYLRDWSKGAYMSTEIVDNAIRLSRDATSALVIVLLPDVDEAGHASGGASAEYLATAKKVDADLARLVGALQDGTTTFVVASDHGHIDTGGHGGWEREVVQVPAVFAGPDIRLGKGTGTQDQIAPVVAYLAGLPALRNAASPPLIVTAAVPDGELASDARFAALTAYLRVVQSGMPAGTTRVTTPVTAGDAAAGFAIATEDRLSAERSERLPMALALAAAAVAVLAAIGLLSWRALVSAGVGTVLYYLVYSGLFFLLHGYRWSLSSFNSEDLLKAFFNGRMIEAIVAGLVACFAAADIYLALRRDPKRPTGEYLPGWLALGTATVLTIQATLALQVAWYLWRWGVALTWVLPDFMWAFKYDLDLIQGTAIGALAILGPVVTYLAGRYHPIRKRVAPAAGETQLSEEEA